MPAGHDDGSPAKIYADQLRKDRKELVEEFRETIEARLGEDPKWCAAVEARARRAGLDIYKLIQ